MTIKINVGVNKKIGLPDYGSAGSHCAIEIEADNSVLDNAEQFLQQVKNAYEVARQSVETELAHHRVSNGTSRSHSNTNREPEQKREYRQEYRNDNTSSANSASSYGIASAKQQQFIASLVKGIKNLDWRKVDKYCDQTFGKSCSQLSPKEASELIDSLKQAKAGGGGGLSA
jgi:hypothetical protein